MTLEPNREAYESAVKLCERKQWMATYWTLKEDGYDPKVDYLALYESWSKE